MGRTATVLLETLIAGVVIGILAMQIEERNSRLHPQLPSIPPSVTVETPDGSLTTHQLPYETAEEWMQRTRQLLLAAKEK